MADSKLVHLSVPRDPDDRSDKMLKISAVALVTLNGFWEGSGTAMGRLGAGAAAAAGLISYREDLDGRVFSFSLRSSRIFSLRT